MIETDRLLLRPMIAEDIDPLLMVFGDPLVMASFGVPPFDRGQMREWVRRNLDHQDQHGYGLFTLILKEPGAIIGDCGLERMELDDGPATGLAVELGYDLRSNFWNRGLATEAAVAVRAFGTLRLPRLVSLIRQGNIASRRVAEKAGMRHERDIIRSGIPSWLFGSDAPDRAFIGDPPPITR
ncbi:MAG: GNAT family N-acetyltransferase [Chloroflexia bacterium]|nr:GNAT family N-acetyltransferase [Chloroflexia bacterium]